MGYRTARHPALSGRERGVWYSDLVGVIRGYPSTQEAHDKRLASLRANSARNRAAGKLTRRGVRNGWANRKPQIAEAGAKAEREGVAIMADLKARGFWAELPTTDGALATEALTFNMILMRDESKGSKLREKAARTVLRHTVGRPNAATVRALMSDGLIARLLGSPTAA